ncbi:resistance to Congo red protein [Glycomyces sp. NPDC048151]|uniref:resistance to Congo red protein n=1 Tax=Glycomyces sp. NPDC048151 TaxID=3364002 RepID=UPI00371E342B
MSSDASPQPYPGDPNQPPQGAYGPPPGAYQPQPYVEPGVPQQPPGAYGPPGAYVPPGGYTPVPVPPNRSGRGRGPKVAVAAILSVVLLAAVGAVVLFKFVLNRGPDPAESFPATASMYVELNLDPSFDQTPKLLEHLQKFDDLEDYDDTDELIDGFIDESGIEGVDADEDVNSWLGRRHGLATWEHDGQTYAVLSLASTDSGAAEDGMAQIRAAAGTEEEQFAYTVEDDHVLVVIGEEGAADALAAAETEAADQPLAESDQYSEARQWLDEDQLLVHWIDMEAVGDLAEMTTGTESDAVQDLYSGHVIYGLSAFDQGFQVTYRMFGDADHLWTGTEGLMDTMGALPASDVAVAAYVPENIDEITQGWLGFFEEFYGVDASAEPVEAPLTDAEYAEYMELDAQYWEGTLAPEDEERYAELENRYWIAGTEDDPYIEETYGPDFGEMESAVGDFAGLLAGATLSGGGNFDAGDEFDADSLHFAALLADDRAQELEDLITTWSEGEPLPEGVEVDGSELSYAGSATAEGTLADDDRFRDFSGNTPAECSVIAWVDLDRAGQEFPDDFEGLEPLSAFAWAHGAEDGDGTGVMRLYLKD